MSSRPDWVHREAELEALLHTTRSADARTQLLAELADYSSAAVRSARVLGSIVPGSRDCESALEWLLRPVFICGHHRSGTTLLQNLLDGHPALLSLPSEGTYFSSFRYVARRTPPSDDMDRFAAEWISRLVDPNFEPHFRLGRSDGDRSPAVDFARLLFGWHAALRDRVPGQFAPLLALAAAYKATAAPASAPYAWIEKTPLNELHVRRFAFFGNARFVQLVRDPRAVFVSLERIYRTAGLGPFDAPATAAGVSRSLRLARRNTRRLGARYLVVRYEDLVGESAYQIERVQKFLGIAPHAALSIPTAGGVPVAANSSFGGTNAVGIHSARLPPVLTAEHSALVGAYSATTARALGYDLAEPALIRRYAIRLQYWPRHALHRLRAALRSLMPGLRR